MTETRNKLHLVCGKIASGKSTLARSLAEAPQSVLISEDVWLSHLFGDEMRDIRDYVRCAAKLRDAIGPHIVDLLRSGVSVVLDFPANTRETRAWMRGLVDAAGVPHKLHYLDVPDAVCKARLHERNAAGSHEFNVSDEEFDRITRHFNPPALAEGFDIQVYAM